MERTGEEKRNSIWRSLPCSTWIMALLLLGLLLSDLLGDERLFSEHENRILAQRPAFSWEKLWNGSFSADYESYLTDQFVGRDSWIRIKTYSQLALGEREIKGIYFAKDDTLIERHTQETVDAGRAEQKQEKLVELVRSLRADFGAGQIQVMLVPTADCIWREKLPAWAEEFDQLSYLKRTDRLLEGTGARRVPVEKLLFAHREEEIYYRTDHHWTSLGAYYGYCAWKSANGYPCPEPEAYDEIKVSDTFLGTLHSKVNVAVRPDVIRIYERPEEQKLQMTDVSEGLVRNALYDYEKLRGKDQYSFFLGGNAPLLDIRTGVEGGGSLLLVKDSYANCFVPFLTEDYSRILVVDKRYYRGKLRDLIRKEQPDSMLILYDVIHFVENF